MNDGNTALAIAMDSIRRQARRKALEEAAKIVDERKAKWAAERERHLSDGEPTSAWVRFFTKAVEAGETAKAIRALEETP